MSKTLKLVICAASLILIGLLISLGALAASGFELTSLNNAKYISDSTSVSEEFDSVNIDGIYCDLNIVVTDESETRIEYTEREGIKYIASCNGNTLSITGKRNLKWYNYIGIFWEKTHMTLYINKSELASLRISGTVGDIMLSEELSLGSVYISTDTGDATLYCNVSGNLDIESDTGDIEVYGTAPLSVKIESDTGDIILSSCNAYGTLYIDSDTGDIELSDVNCALINIIADTADTYLENVIASDSITIESDTGDIDLQLCDASSLSLTSDTGDISGVFLTEKIFYVSSDTGKERFPMSSFGGICKAVSDTGDIEFSFAK